MINVDLPALTMENLSRKAPLLLTIALVLSSIGSSGQKTLDCRAARNGVFAMDAEDKNSTSVVTRKGRRQTEVVSSMGMKMRFKVTWTGECTYVLTDRRVLKGEEPWRTRPTDTLFVRILSVTEEEVRIEGRSNFATLQVEGVMRRLK